jgi:hypothetical protein
MDIPNDGERDRIHPEYIPVHPVNAMFQCFSNIRCRDCGKAEGTEDDLAKQDKA